jgi:hypothetical protein
MSYRGYRAVYWQLGVFITCGASGCVFLRQVSRFKNWAARYDRIGVAREKYGRVYTYRG